MTTATAPRRTSTLGATLVAAATSATVAVTMPVALSWHRYLWLLAALTVAAAIAGAIADVRTLTLPNRFVAPLAAAATVQVAASSLHTGLAEAAAAGAAAAAVFLTYLGMAALGWCGAGDAKFAGALTLIVGLYVGLLAIYLFPIAMLFGALQALGATTHQHPSRRPHGPAIAAAAALLMLAGLLLSGSATQH